MKTLPCVAVAVLLVLALAVAIFAQDKSEEKTEPTKEKPTAVKATPKEKPKGNPMVLLETNYGDMTLELFQKEAPISVKNFLSYVNDGFYDGTVFHRVVKGFVLQAGGMNEEMKQKEQSEPIKNEATNGLSNKRGTLSMARTSAINSGTSHFFINLVDNKRLDHSGMEPAKYGYAVFGEIANGMDVVDKIAQVQVTNKGQFQNVPAKPVVIKKASVVGAPTKVKKADEKQPEKEVKIEEKKAKED
jgi:cyclophilin family peptidyl-prolyl cis-trans isomerase